MSRGLKWAVWTLCVIAILVAVAARWSDGTSMAAILPTRALSIAAGLAAAGLAVLGAALTGWSARIAAFVAVAAALANALPMSWPYRSSDIAFLSGDIGLEGTVFRPAGRPVAGVVFIHGSGPQIRLEFAYHAKQLARRGIAAFAYDKRGAGASQGSSWVSYEVLAADAAAALTALQADIPAVARGQRLFRPLRGRLGCPDRRHAGAARLHRRHGHR